MTNPDSQKSWVILTVSSLREAGSWTGRIHIHKHIFITQVLGLAKPPFVFELYQYGPYSFGLDRIIAEMEAYGNLSKDYQKPRYGPRYKIPVEIQSLIDKLSPRYKHVIEHVSKVLGKMDSRDLELIATCLWVDKREGVHEVSELATVVNLIKPRYEIADIKQANERAKNLEKELIKS